MPDTASNDVGYLRKKAQNENTDDIDAYKAMAADTEREQEAREMKNGKIKDHKL